MNKKGFIGGASSFIFGFIGFFILILVLVALVPVDRGLVTANETLTSLNAVQNSTLSEFVTNDNNTVLTNVVYSMIYFVIYSSFEVTKLGVEYGISHPEVINPVTLLWLILISLLLPILFYSVRFIALVIVLVNEILHSRIDKRRLKKLREKQGNTDG